MRRRGFDVQDDVRDGAGEREADEERSPLRVHHCAYHAGLVMGGHHYSEKHDDQTGEGVEGDGGGVWLVEEWVVRLFGTGSVSVVVGAGCGGLVLDFMFFSVLLL